MPRGKAVESVTQYLAQTGWLAPVLASNFDGDLRRHSMSARGKQCLNILFNFHNIYMLSYLPIFTFACNSTCVL